MSGRVSAPVMQEMWSPDVLINRQWIFKEREGYYLTGRRRWIAALIGLILLLMMTSGIVQADSNQIVRLYVDGVQTLFPDQQPYIDQNGRTMVPARFCSLALGAQVEWQADGGKIIISRQASGGQAARQAVLTIGSKELTVDGQDPIIMDAPAVLADNRTMVPVRFISEVFNCTVTWDVNSRSVHVFTKQQSEDEQKRIIQETSGLGTELPRINNAETLQNLLYKSGANMYRDDYLLPSVNMMKEAAPAPQSTNIAATAEGADFSATNTQVEGVDESDIVKTDGSYIYQVKQNNAVAIVKAVPVQDMALTAKITLQQRPKEMYVNNNRLILVQDDYRYEPYLNVMEMPVTDRVQSLMPMPPYRYRDQTVVTVYDTTDKTNPAKIDEYTLPGNYLSSRKIENSVYIITSESIYQPFEPVYRINGQEHKKAYSEIRYFPDIQHQAYLHIATVQTGGTESDFALETFLGSGNNVYCSQNSLYIAANEYSPIFYQEGRISRGQNSVIYKFNLGNTVRYASRGRVPGTILNQFSMDEYNGNFRIATTDQDWSSGASSSGIYILDNSMQTVNSINGIAPGERIYSARFMGGRAYLVTFKQIDPLFVIDLDPSNPKILGKLKIPGFSNYLHPYGDHYLIGLGSEVETVQKWDRATGIKLSLFDVQDVNNPLEVAKTVIGTSGSHSEATAEHKAFMLYQNILAFPITVYAPDPGGTSSSFEFQGAYVYDLSLQSLQLKGRITHLDQQDYLKAGQYWYGNDKEIRRIIYMNGNLYTISDHMILSNQADNMAELDRVETD